MLDQLMGTARDGKRTISIATVFARNNHYYVTYTINQVSGNYLEPSASAAHSSALLPAAYAFSWSNPFGFGMIFCVT